MSHDLIRGQKPDYSIDLPKVGIPLHCLHEIHSMEKERGHVPYRCTRSYKVSNHNKSSDDNKSKE